MFNMEEVDHAKEAAKSLGLDTCSDRILEGREFDMKLMGETPIVLKNIAYKDGDDFKGPPNPTPSCSKAFDMQKKTNGALEHIASPRTLTLVHPKVMRKILLKYESEANYRRFRKSTTPPPNSDTEDEDDDYSSNASGSGLSGVQPEVLQEMLLKVEAGTYKRDVRAYSRNSDPMSQMPLMDNFAAKIKQIFKEQEDEEDSTVNEPSIGGDGDGISTASTILMNIDPDAARRPSPVRNNIPDYHTICSFHFLVFGLAFTFLLSYVFFLCGRNNTSYSR